MPPWQIPSFHQLGASLLLSKKSTPLQSSKSRLFFGNAGVWGWASRTQLRDTRVGGIPGNSLWRFVPRATQFNNILWNQHLQKCKKTKDFKYVHNQHLCENRGEGVAIN